MVRAALVERRRGCGEQLLRAFAEARPDLLNALTLLLGSRDDAQDAAQEAFLKCWRKRDGVGGIYNLRAWIFRVGLNSGRDLRRNVWRQRSRPLLDREPTIERPAPSPNEELIHRETLDRLRAALQQLRPEERDVFLLRQNTDRTYDEIARLRRAPIGTVKTQMRAALQKLRKVLQEAPEG
ncbi:MAG TPA: RNA polymerase sigma factor [Gemmataceae bacterium]|nr:RNA polymerase sigma factor [Gemmataceae bacterium]